MPIHVGWGNHEETFVVWRFEEPWTKEEFIRYFEISSTMLANKPYMVDIILDLRRMKSTLNLPELLRYAIRNASANRGILVFISPSDFYRQLFLVSGLAHLSQLIHFVNSVDEAYQIVYAAQAQRDYPFAID